MIRLAATLLLAIAPVAGAAAPPSPTITFSRQRMSAVTGQVLSLESVVTNPGATPTGRMIAHLNVTSLDGVYVDLEDWSQEVTASVAPVPAGGETELDWEVQAVNTGRFAIYVVLLPDGGGPLVVSPPVNLTVAPRKTLNAGGALPVSIAMPVLLGLLTLATRYRLRRTG
ncbi:MAG TPA: hypothetical protein VFT31_07035 [Kribbella sp.]|nr:hypothetical protein [Kribbella sp.]